VHAERREQPGEGITGGAGLVAGPEPVRPVEASNQAADRFLVVEVPLDIGSLMTGVEDPDRVLPYVGSARNGG
jgi:hypothetical protein